MGAELPVLLFTLAFLLTILSVHDVRAQQTSNTSASATSLSLSALATSTTVDPITSATLLPTTTQPAYTVAGVYQTALVLAVNSAGAAEAVSILQGYGQPLEFLAVAQNGTALPPLETINSDGTSVGNYGLIVIISNCVYNYGGTIGWASSITSDQFNAIYAYQAKYHVRAVYLDSFPGWFQDVTAAAGSGGCCASEEQYVHLTNTSFIPTAGLRTADLSTVGLWHYPATINNTNTTTAFLEFAPNTEYPTTTVAGVVQTISGREQMIFFLDGGTWSLTTNYLCHIWFHWGYRGIYTGFRRVAMHQHVDDMFLDSDIWNDTTIADLDGKRSRINTNDLAIHMEWLPQFVQTLNPGSVYFMETGFNGNGNMDYVGDLTSVAAENCPSSVDVNDPVGPNVNVEWIKPLGTGTNQWPSDVLYNWTLNCLEMDPLLVWFQNTTNRDFFAWTSHTFTHEDLENATYYDTNLELSFNYKHAQFIGLTKAKMWSNKTFIPPSISGMHNGDALRAIWGNGIIGGVGDSTRPALCNPNNQNWPRFTTVEENGFAGYAIIPRWASRIYYNVGNQYESPDEWRALSPSEAATGAGDIYALLEYERVGQSAHIIGLNRAPFMFHQANLRVADVGPTTINGVTKARSLYMMWAETIGAQITALVNWPLVALKLDDLVQVFLDRMTKDLCNPTTQLIFNTGGTTPTVVGFTVGCTGNTCSVPIPVTIPFGNVTNLQGSTVEQIGNDPMTLWVKLSGKPVTFTLTEPIPL